MWSHLPSRLPAVAACILAGWVLWPQRALSHETLTTTVLFDREIVRILNKHCVMCHVENGPSFPLETYEQTWVQARKIRAQVIARHMPPWSAFPGYGVFANDNSLTLRETQFIVSWVEGSGPRNAGTVFTNTADPNAVRRKEVRAEPDFGHWELGEPQLKLPVAGNVTVERTIIDTGLKTERRVRALEYMPGDRPAVRAAFFTVQETGQWIGAWTPWYSHFSVPQGSAWRLPAGSHIVAEIHYADSKANNDRGALGTLGLFFAEQPSPKPVADIVIESKGDVPAGAAAQKFRAETRLAADTNALALRVQAQLGVQSVEVSARKPDGTTEVLLFEKNIRADWPTPYVFKDPVALPRGAELFATAYYANPGSSPQPGGVRITVSSNSRVDNKPVRE
jgi:hypothetical protein